MKKVSEALPARMLKALNLVLGDLNGIRDHTRFLFLSLTGEMTGSSLNLVVPRSPENYPQPKEAVVAHSFLRTYCRNIVFSVE